MEFWTRLIKCGSHFLIVSQTMNMMEQWVLQMMKIQGFYWSLLYKRRAQKKSQCLQEDKWLIGNYNIHKKRKPVVKMIRISKCSSLNTRLINLQLLRTRTWRRLLLVQGFWIPNIRYVRVMLLRSLPHLLLSNQDPWNPVRLEKRINKNIYWMLNKMKRS